MGNLVKETPYSEITATLEVLDKLGIKREHLIDLRSDSEFAKRVVEVIRKGPTSTMRCRHCGSTRLEPDPAGNYFDARDAEGSPYLCSNCRNPKDYTILGRAKKIMGKNMLTLPNVEWHFDVRFTEAEEDRLYRIPWSEEVLEECKYTHILFPGYPLTILDIRDKAPKVFAHSYECAWYNNQDFARKEKVNLRWYLIRKESLEGFFESYSKQKNLLKKNEEIPRAVEVIYMTALYYLANNVRLFENYYVRCPNFHPRDYCIYVGDFDRDDGLYVANWGYNDSNAHFGLVTSRKPNS